MATSPPTSVTASSSPLDVRTSGTDLEGTKYALRWGIIGASNIASDFVKSLGGVPGATVGAVAARNPAKAQAFADTHGIAKIHANYAELVADPDIDIVYVGTITVCHKEHCMLAIEAGKHILCEKPLAASVPDAEEMYAAAAVRGVMLQEGMWTRFFPAVEHARALVSAGELGQITMAHSEFCFNAVDFEGADNPMFDAKLAGGGALPVGCYVAQASVMAFGAMEPTTVAAAGVCQALNPSGPVDLSCGATVQYPAGLAVIAYSLSCETDEVTDIIGTRGRLRLSPGHCPTELKVVKDTAVRGAPQTQEHSYALPEPSGYPAAGWHYPNQHGFVYQAEAVHRCLAAGLLECPQFTKAESISTLAITLAMRNAALAPQLRPEPSSSCPSAAFEAKGVKVCDASICAGPLRLPAVPPEDMR